jgi:hypothetical protein
MDEFIIIREAHSTCSLVDPCQLLLGSVSLCALQHQFRLIYQNLLVRYVLYSEAS